MRLHITERVQIMLRSYRTLHLMATLRDMFFSFQNVGLEDGTLANVHDDYEVILLLALQCNSH